MPDEPTDAPIPVQHQARQVPAPPEGTLPAWLYKTFGPSYRTTLAAWGTSVSAVAAFIQALCPNLMNFVWNRHEATLLFWAILAAGGLVKFGTASKDKSATGVEK